MSRAAMAHSRHNRSASTHAKPRLHRTNHAAVAVPAPGEQSGRGSRPSADAGVRAHRTRTLLALAVAIAGALAFTLAQPKLALALMAVAAGLLVWSRIAATEATVGAAATPVATPRPDPRFGRAVRDFRDGNYRVAFQQFAQLADEGDTRAARVALRMLSDGPRTYEIERPVRDTQLARWRSAAHGGGADTAHHKWFVGHVGPRQ